MPGVNRLMRLKSSSGGVKARLGTGERRWVGGRIGEDEGGDLRARGIKGVKV